MHYVNTGDVLGDLQQAIRVTCMVRMRCGSMEGRDDFHL